MTRVDEAEKRYPSIPRHVILRHDVLVEGIRDSEDLYKEGVWTGALSLYQSVDYDVTSFKDMVVNTPQRVRGHVGTGW